MTTIISSGCEVSSDGRTVWVNDKTGCNVGRFAWAGIDVHHSAQRQVELGQQCLDCKKGPTNMDDWLSFQAAMRLHHGVIVGDEHMPNFLRAAA